MRLPRLRAVTPNWQSVLVKAVTSACRHAPFPAFGGTRNDGMGKGFRSLNRNLGPLGKLCQISDGRFKIGYWFENDPNGPAVCQFRKRGVDNPMGGTKVIFMNSPCAGRPQAALVQDSHVKTSI